MTKKPQPCTLHFCVMWHSSMRDVILLNRFVGKGNMLLSFSLFFFFFLSLSLFSFCSLFRFFVCLLASFFLFSCLSSVWTCLFDFFCAVLKIVLSHFVKFPVFSDLKFKAVNSGDHFTILKNNVHFQRHVVSPKSLQWRNWMRPQRPVSRHY